MEILITSIITAVVFVMLPDYIHMEVTEVHNTLALLGVGIDMQIIITLAPTWRSHL